MEYWFHDSLSRSFICLCFPGTLLTVPRKNPVPERERQICQRLRLVRKEKRLSQVAFADMLGIDSSLLASYEHARVPIRYEFADRLCCIFRVCQRWLAGGVEPRRVYVPIPEDVHQKLPARGLFSEVYDDFLEPYIAEYFSKPWRWGRDIGVLVESERIEEIFSPNKTPVNSDEFFYYLLGLVRPALAKHSSLEYGELYRLIAAAVRYFRGRREPSFLTVGNKGLEKELTESSEIRNTADAMKRELTIEWLLGEVRRLTEPAGMKAKLAAYLKVPQARVSEWLADKYKPSGETVLRILHWVQNPSERK
jgi:transcriptional regulator with XRE-family HTH domain